MGHYVKPSLSLSPEVCGKSQRHRTAARDALCPPTPRARSSGNRRDGKLLSTRPRYVIGASVLAADMETALFSC